MFNVCVGNEMEFDSVFIFGCFWENESVSCFFDMWIFVVVFFFVKNWSESIFVIILFDDVWIVGYVVLIVIVFGI